MRATLVSRKGHPEVFMLTVAALSLPKSDTDKNPRRAALGHGNLGAASRENFDHNTLRRDRPSISDRNRECGTSPRSLATAAALDTRLNDALVLLNVLSPEDRFGFREDP